MMPGAGSFALRVPQAALQAGRQAWTSVRYQPWLRIPATAVFFLAGAVHMALVNRIDCRRTRRGRRAPPISGTCGPPAARARSARPPLRESRPEALWRRENRPEALRRRCEGVRAGHGPGTGRVGPAGRRRHRPGGGTRAVRLLCCQCVPHAGFASGARRTLHKERIGALGEQAEHVANHLEAICAAEALDHLLRPQPHGWASLEVGGEALPPRGCGHMPVFVTHSDNNNYDKSRQLTMFDKSRTALSGVHMQERRKHAESPNTATDSHADAAARPPSTYLAQRQRFQYKCLGNSDQTTVWCAHRAAHAPLGATRWAATRAGLRAADNAAQGTAPASSDMNAALLLGAGGNTSRVKKKTRHRNKRPRDCRASSMGALLYLLAR